MPAPRLHVKGEFGAGDIFAGGPSGVVEVEAWQSWSVNGVDAEPPAGVVLSVGGADVRMTHYQARYLADLLTAAANVAGQ